jgi:hypothetical protein
MHVCISACVDESIYVRLNAYINGCMIANMYVYVCMCMYDYTYICMYVCMHERMS